MIPPYPDDSCLILLRKPRAYKQGAHDLRTSQRDFYVYTALDRL